MDVEKESREKQELQRVMSSLELTAKNRELAEQYLDLKKPADANLLKEVEHQCFQGLQRNEKHDGYYFLETCKEKNAELAERFIRFIAEIGRETSQGILAYWEFNREYEYLGQILPASLQTAIHVNAAAWHYDNLRMTYLSPFVESGFKDPEQFQQARDQCQHTDAPCSAVSVLRAAIRREQRQTLYSHRSRPKGCQRPRAHQRDGSISGKSSDQQY